ncbi:hypothetical protein B0H10DRAFT_2199739 [Mycena sp. CBHHK59/15]|nr:hypothetical protein B0H10DRAFT_2199739 [Mycena sp. CBHHK59/15]
MPPPSGTKKKPGVEDWRWGAFWKGKFYGNNKTHKEARCRGDSSSSVTLWKISRPQSSAAAATFREDNLPEPEIAEVIRRPVIQLHFGTEELYELDKIFTEASINAVSMWGGSLLTYQVDGMSDLNNIMADFEEDGPGNCGPDEIIIDDD